MNIASYTLGCKLNQYESEALVSKFRDRGFSVVGWQGEAEIYIINTCTVTSKSEQKARRVIRKVSREHPESAVIVTGCYAQLDPEEIRQLGLNVHVVSQESKSTISELAEFLQNHSFSGGDVNSIVDSFFAGKDSSGDPFAFDTNDFRFHSRAYLKVQDGCNNFCSYCRIPLARGRSISLDYREVMKRAEVISEAGYDEIVITGINVSAYLYDGVDFAGLLSLLADRFRGTSLKIRLSSIEPDSFSEELYKVLADDVFCPHFHLPLQSCSTPVLRSMKRKYDADIIPGIFENLRKIKDNPFIAADLITGYPGESDNNFEETYSMLEKMKLSHIHVFPFSPREGTAQENPVNPVPERIRDERAERLRGLSEIGENFYKNNSDKRNVSFVAEKKLDKFEAEAWSVVTDNYLRGICFSELQRGQRYMGIIEVQQNGTVQIKRV